MFLRASFAFTTLRKVFWCISDFRSTTSIWIEALYNGIWLFCMTRIRIAPFFHPMNKAMRILVKFFALLQQVTGLKKRYFLNSFLFWLRLLSLIPAQKLTFLIPTAFNRSAYWIPMPGITVIRFFEMIFSIIFGYIWLGLLFMVLLNLPLNHILLAKDSVFTKTN